MRTEVDVGISIFYNSEGVKVLHTGAQYGQDGKRTL